MLTEILLRCTSKKKKKYIFSNYLQELNDKNKNSNYK